MKLDNQNNLTESLEVIDLDGNIIGRSYPKLLCVDATGVWLCVRRLHRGSFIWPRSHAELMAVSAAQMDWLAMGVDWQRMSADLGSVPRLL